MLPVCKLRFMHILKKTIKENVNKRLKLHKSCDNNYRMTDMSNINVYYWSYILFKVKVIFT